MPAPRTSRRWPRLALLLAAATLVARGQAEDTRPARDPAPPVIRLPDLEVVAAVPSDPAPEPVLADPVTLPLTRLLMEPGLETQAQGTLGTQTDLRINGSAFSGAGLAVAGLALRNPQTEHFNTELPLAPALFAPPSVDTGLANVLDSTGQLVGTAAFAFAPIQEPLRQLEAGAGGGGHYWENAMFQAPLSPHRLPGLGGTVFAAHETAERTDGYDDNDLSASSGGGHLQWFAPDQQSDVAFGAQDKRFGARGYYGAPAQYPAEEELHDRLLVLSHQREFGDDTLRLSGLWRRLEDQYWLNRDQPQLYKNHNVNEVWAGAADGIHTMNEQWAMRWRLEGEADQLHSTYAGQWPGTSLGDHFRTQGGLTLAPQFTQGPWTVTAGARGMLYRGENPALLPLAGLDYRLNDRHALYASYTRTERLPSYTELNYNSPGSLGNQGLQPQTNDAFELGWRRTGQVVDWKTALLANLSRNTVDWTKTGPADRWTATDLGTVDTVGATASGNWRATRTVKFDGGLDWLWKTTPSPAPYASRYVLDYPQARLRIGVAWEVTERVRLQARASVWQQTGNPVREDGRLGNDVGLEGSVLLIRRYGLRLAAGLTNALYSEFETFPGQPVAGLQAYTRLSATW